MMKRVGFPMWMPSPKETRGPNVGRENSTITSPGEMLVWLKVTPSISLSISRKKSINQSLIS